MKIKWIGRIAMLALGSALLFSSCVRERDYDIDLAQDETVGDFVYNDAFHIACDAATKGTGELLANYKAAGYCATLVHDTFSSPRTILVDFGTVNCMCNDGRTRRGKILVSYTLPYADSGNIISFNFDQYFVNDYHVMGTQVIENKGKNVLNQTYFSQDVQGKILSADTSIKDTLEFVAERKITWVAGEGTPMWFDDRYETVGFGHGWGVRHEYFAMNVTEPLVRDVLCRYYTAGKVELQPQGKALRTIDYGDGECDQDASVEINNKRFAFELK